MAPQDFDVNTEVDSYSGTIGLGAGGLGNSFDRITAGNNNYTPGVEQHDNEYIYVKNYNGISASDITHNITNNPWVESNWYLVDVEYDDFIPGTDPGEILIYGVAPLGGFISGGEINEEGVGLYSGDTVIAHCELVPTLRTEYGAQDTVLRGIFQIASDSWVLSNEPNKFTLRVLGCTGGIKINKIVTKKLNTITTAGSVNDWSDYAPIASSPTHSFSDNVMYYKKPAGQDGKLCWELPADGSGIYLYHTWSQDSIKGLGI